MSYRGVQRYIASDKRKSNFLDFTISGEIKRQLTIFEFQAGVLAFLVLSLLKVEDFRMLLPFSVFYLWEIEFSDVFIIIYNIILKRYLAY